MALMLAALGVAAPARGQRIQADDEGATVVIAGLCDAITRYRPDPSVDYVPGVDAAGQPVAPADLPDSDSLHLSEDDISLDLRLPLAQFFNIPPDLQPVIGDALVELGHVTLRHGVPYLGGKPLAGQQQHALAEACAALLRGEDPTPPAPPLPSE